MLVYNTTYHVGNADARNFVIWINECYIPKVLDHGTLKNPRLSRVLSHREQDSECFALQWEVESMAEMHHWHTEQGEGLNDELLKIFKEKVIAFSTLMEVLN